MERKESRMKSRLYKMSEQGKELVEKMGRKVKVFAENAEEGRLA